MSDQVIDTPENPPEIVRSHETSNLHDVVTPEEVEDKDAKLEHPEPKVIITVDETDPQNDDADLEKHQEDALQQVNDMETGENEERTEIIHEEAKVEEDDRNIVHASVEEGEEDQVVPSDQVESTDDQIVTEEQAEDVKDVEEVKADEPNEVQKISEVIEPEDDGSGHYNFQKECLDAHNVLREQHGCQLLNWNADLAQDAQNWAEKIAERGYLMYFDSPGLGENIQIFPASPNTPLISGNQVAEKWGSERQNFDFKVCRWQTGTNHFTQMIWKSTTDLGVGRAPTRYNDKVVVVAFYKPAGNLNYPGNFSDNVPNLIAEQ